MINNKLSKRENEVLTWLLTGRTIKQIAQEMKLSPRTIESYLQGIKDKSGLIYKQDIINFFNNKVK